MVRSYRKYEFTTSFGVISSATSNVIWASDSSSTLSSRITSSGKAYTSANEEVLCWDVKRGELLSRWRDQECDSQVTVIAQCNSQPDLFAVGHADGSIRIWDSLSATILLTFNGHRSAITHLVFDREGLRLASGSKDTDIILWNLLNEAAEYKLRGHKDQITGLAFLDQSEVVGDEDVSDAGNFRAQNVEPENYLLSTSKDSLIKLWDLTTPHCIETHVAQSNGECWALGVSPDGHACITAGNDGELKVWSVDSSILANLGNRSGDPGQVTQCMKEVGILLRHNKDRTTNVQFHHNGSFVSVHGSEKAVELFRIRSPEEVRKSLLRKRRRRKEKAAAQGDAQMDSQEELGLPEVDDIFVPHVILRTGAKVRSAVWTASGSSKQLSLLIASSNNQLEMYSIEAKHDKKSANAENGPEYTRSFGVDMPGHRTDIRAMAISSDDRMVVTASVGLLKAWNVRTQSCLRTIECGPSLCCAFLPGDKIVLVGTKTGELELYDIASSTMIEKYQAHDGAVWTLQVHPDGKSVATGGADKCAKFWNFDIVQEEIPGTKRTRPQLKLTHTRTLKVADDVLSLCFTPDSKLIALSTLDNTVKVFFTDSLKLFLTLYGHKLPVLSISIASDSKLIATSSADKNVRIWGLDFGDCHKAFFAHQDSVMQVSFIPHPVENDERHVFFSAGKDSLVKSWDGDKFEQIQKFTGHHGEIWAMVVSRTGEKIITASHDKSIRIWDIGDDLIFLEEERERELEQTYEATLAAQMDRDLLTDEQGENRDEVAAASKQTISTLTYGEKIMEALEIAEVDRLLVDEWNAQHKDSTRSAPPQRNPLFMALGGISAEQHVLNTITKIPAASLNDALLVIPFSTLPVLFTFLALFFQRGMQPELSWRVFYFLLQAHNNQLVASKKLKGVMTDILDAYTAWTKRQKSIIGYNVAALSIMSKDVRQGGFQGLEDEEQEIARVEKGRKKRTFASVA